MIVTQKAAKFLLFFILVSIQSFGQVIPSVPLVGPVGLSTVPAGWTLIDDSPDFESLPLTPVWADWGPLPSDLTGLPAGVERICYTHCLDHWASSTLKGEAFGIQITGLTIGEEYSFETYTGGSNHFSGTTVDDVHSSMWAGETVAAIEAMGDSPTQVGRDVTLDLNFVLETWTFTATNTTMWIVLGPSSDSYRDWNDIGVVWALVNPDVSEVLDCDDLVTTVSATDICIDGEVTLTATSANGGIVTWDGGVVDGVSFEPPVGTTTYTATSDNEADCVFSVDITVHELPDVTATIAPEEICLGETFTFTGGGADTYVWDMGVIDGTPFEPLTIGTETYTVTGIDEFGCENTASVDGIVSPSPVCSFEFVINGESSEDGALGGCVSSLIQFNDLSTVAGPGTVIGWNWSFGDGTTSTEENPTHEYMASGTYTITLTVMGSGGCSATFSRDIIMTNGLTMDILSNNPTCYQIKDGSVTVNITGGSGELVFEITDADDNLLNEDNSNTANTLGEGWYYINVSDDSECAGIDSVYLSQPDELDIDISVVDPLCYGFETGTAVVTDVYNFTGSEDLISYFWSPNPGGNSGIGEDSTWGMGKGVYTVTINDENGCSKVFDFTIDEPKELVFSEFGFEPALCRLHEYQSGNGTVFGAVIGGEPDYTYLWRNLDNGEESITSTWGGLNPGNYELTATDANGCVIKNTVILDSLKPEAVFSVNSDQLNADCKGTAVVEVEFTNQSINYQKPSDPDPNFTFFWNLDTINADWQITHDVTEVFDTVYGAKGETYYVDVCLIVTNKNGCSDMACKEITIYEPIAFDDVNIFSPNGDGVNDIFTFKHKAASISVFNCVIVNRWGTVVHELNNIDDGWDGTDKSGDKCSAGVYFYKYTGKSDNNTDISGQGSLQIVY